MAKKNLKNSVVLITGGARGIGRATAAEFAKRGARVVLADLDFAECEIAARALGGSAHRLDVTDRVAFDAVVARVEAQVGPIDVLVNNAGIMSLGAFLDLDENNDEKQIAVNLRGVLNGMRAVIPSMRRRGRGHIVNVASLAGRIGIPHATTYTATKFAVIGATESARNELLGSGLDFTYVMPYLVNTELASGTKGLLWPPVVEPEDVARALVRGVERRDVEVYVPRIGQLTAALPHLLPRRVVDVIGKMLGLHGLFGTVDAGQRAAYLDRVGTSASPAAKQNPPARESIARPTPRDQS